MEHRGDATIVYCGDARPLDEIALTLRRLFGERLDAHDDPRGIFFFISEHSDPRGQSYDALVRELGGDRLPGVDSLEKNDRWKYDDLPGWGPKVDAAHVPYVYSRAAPGEWREMVPALIRERGVAGEAMALSLFSMMIGLGYSHFSKSNAGQWRPKLEEIAAIMGREFAAELEARMIVELNELKANDSQRRLR